MARGLYHNRPRGRIGEAERGGAERPSAARMSASERMRRRCRNCRSALPASGSARTAGHPGDLRGERGVFRLPVKRGRYLLHEVAACRAVCETEISCAWVFSLPGEARRWHRLTLSSRPGARSPPIAAQGVRSGADGRQLEVIELASGAADDAERPVASGLDHSGMAGGAEAVGTDFDPPRAGREGFRQRLRVIMRLAKALGEGHQSPRFLLALRG
ncbi:MAG: hypothetical protein JWO24_1727 [Rhodospirillales bacterium]|nr:hypothetical protein [Rhodospirillales bacterium]